MMREVNIKNKVKVTITKGTPNNFRVVLLFKRIRLRPPPPGLITCISTGCLLRNGVVFLQLFSTGKYLEILD